MRIGLIYNPSAGGGRGGVVGSLVQEHLTRHGLEVVVQTTRAPREATTLARDLAGRVDAVVAVGGDGTVNEVVNGLAGGGVPLGIVPAGTVNVLAQELGLPFAVDRACDVIVAGRTTTLDLGLVDGRRFILMVGAGLDALTIRELDPRLKRRFKELAFIGTGVRAYGRHHHPVFEVIVNGTAHRATFVVVGNCRYYGGRFGVTSRADPTDGLLDVVVFRGRGLARTLLFWMGVPLGLHVHHPDVSYLTGTEVELQLVDAGDVVWFHTDGELAGRLPVRVCIEKSALRVFVTGNEDGRRAGNA